MVRQFERYCIALNYVMSCVTDRKKQTTLQNCWCTSSSNISWHFQPWREWHSSSNAWPFFIAIEPSLTSTSSSRLIFGYINVRRMFGKSAVNFGISQKFRSIFNIFCRSNSSTTHKKLFHILISQIILEEDEIENTITYDLIKILVKYDMFSVSNAWHDIIKCNKISLELTQHNGHVAFCIAIEPSLTNTSSSRLIFGYTSVRRISLCSVSVKKIYGRKLFVSQFQSLRKIDGLKILKIDLNFWDIPKFTALLPNIRLTFIYPNIFHKGFDQVISNSIFDFIFL
jgi:hypothetical protein